MFQGKLNVKKVLRFPIITFKKMLLCEIPLKFLFKINISHPYSIVISEFSKIGNNVTIYQNVTIGKLKQSLLTNDAPIIENDVIIYANSLILGKGIIPKGTVIPCGSIIKLYNGEIYKK